MATRILVVHGPNLNLLGERPGDERGRTLAELDGAIRKLAGQLGLEVKIVQSNHEGVLVDTLHAERRWADGIIINPEALTHTSYVLREALAAVNRPALEVHLTDIRRRESWRRKSVIKDVCAGQVMGKGFDSYLVALQRFATGDLTGRKRTSRALEQQLAATKTVGPKPAKSPAAAVALAKTLAVEKSIGRRVERATSAPKGTPAVKTLGRDDRSTRPEPAAPAAKSMGREAQRTAARAAKEGATEFLTRALVRQKIADRLAGKVTPGALAAWARLHWMEVRGGAAAETGHREDLEDALQALTLSTVPASKLSDEQLIDLMATLEG